MPDTDDSETYLLPVARCVRKILADKGKPATADKVIAPFGYWCERWAPHLSADQIGDIVQQALNEPYFDRDDVLGVALRLSYAERQRLQITTIGSFDVDRRARKRLNRDRKRERDRLRAAENRRAKGATPRAESLSRTKPWEQMGVSRRTYYRRMANGGTSSSPHPSYISASDDVVPLGTTPAACEGREVAPALRPKLRPTAYALAGLSKVEGQKIPAKEVSKETKPEAPPRLSEMTSGERLDGRIVGECA
ncbi:hypothetical protein [Bradyrhizobium murdochi]|uniref:hypothetical protein n=1 Tax=Bradyrhizobium murdochi TaxID=1038859 RepID=UPI0012EB0BAC|nr:hypothetical protein [Bradyrhizobium murdochi]